MPSLLWVHVNTSCYSHYQSQYQGHCLFRWRWQHTTAILSHCLLGKSFKSYPPNSSLRLLFSTQQILILLALSCCALTRSESLDSCSCRRQGCHLIAFCAPYYYLFSIASHTTVINSNRLGIGWLLCPVWFMTVTVPTFDTEPYFLDPRPQRWISHDPPWVCGLSWVSR